MAMDVVCSNTTSMETNQRFQIVCLTPRIFFLHSALRALGAPPILSSSKDATAEVYRKEAEEEEHERLARIGDLNGTS